MNMMKKPIVCCGFTPCIQRILEFSRVEKGKVNRAEKVTLGIGGKGANTARMVHQLGAEALLLGFSGGPNGRLLEKMLDAEGVAYRHVEVSGNTRICQTLVEAGNPETTELVEEMPPISDAEWERMASLFGALDLSGTIVPVSGKLPAGAPVDAYARIAAIAAASGGRVMIDAPGEPLLRALEQEPFLVKCNDTELSATVGGEDLVDSCLRLVGLGARSVLVTRGSRTAFFVDESRTLEITPPRIQAVNPVGSGDAVTAGMAVALAQGGSMQEAITRGMACGAANALTLRSGTLRVEDVERLESGVVITEVQ